MSRNIVLVLTPHELRNVEDALTKYANWISSDTEPGAAQDRRAVERIFDQIARAKVKVDTPARPAPRLDPLTRTRRGYPKCADVNCLHSVNSHNDLGYCQVGAGTKRACHCGGYIDPKETSR